MNDTFPEPEKKLSEIYILFSIGEEKVYVVSSSDLAKKCKCRPSVKKRFEISQKALINFGKKLFETWEGIGISTAARPTYRMDKKYAHHDASSKEIARIFSKAGIDD